MKILHLTRHLDIGGIPRYVVDLCAQLQANGQDVFVASTGGIQVAALQKVGIVHLHVPLSSKFEFGPNLWRSWWALRPVLEKVSFDVVHAHTRMAQVLAALLGQKYLLRTVTTCHGFFKPNLGRRLWPCWGQKVIAISPAVQRHLIQTHRVAGQSIVCIPNGIDLRRYAIDNQAPEIIASRQRLGIPAKARVIGTTARLCPVKGLEYLIEAMGLLQHTYPHLVCLIIGDGPSRGDLQKLAQGLGLEKKVIFVGALADVAPALALMDIFVLPSLMEGLGLAILEAFAAGKPVIASRVGGIVDVVHDRENGMLVEPANPKAIADAVMALLSDTTLAQRLSAKAMQTVATYFSLDRMVSQVEEVYKT